MQLHVLNFGSTLSTLDSCAALLLLAGEPTSKTTRCCGSMILDSTGVMPNLKSRGEILKMHRPRLTLAHSTLSVILVPCERYVLFLHDQLLKSYKSQGRTSCCQRDRRPRQLTSASGMRFRDVAMTTVSDSRSHFSLKVLCISLSFMLWLQAFCSSSKTLVNEPYFVIIFVVFKSFLGKDK